MSTSDRVIEKVKVAKSFFVQDLETAMIKATKRNSKQPKWKHVSILLNATWRRDVSISELGWLLESRINDSSWSVVFKALIVAHVMMDQGSSDRLIGYLATQPSILNLVHFRDASSSRIEQAKNISRYAAYLEEKVHVYRETKRDYCRPSSPTTQTSQESYGSMLRSAHLPTDVARVMRTSPVTDALVLQLQVILRLFKVLLKTHFHASDIDNDVTLYAFRLLVRDLIRLYHIINEGMINLLENIATVPIAASIIDLFKQFVLLSPSVDLYLATAKSIPKHRLLMDVPEFKHIPDISAHLQQELGRGNLSAPPRSPSPVRPHESAASPQSTDHTLIDFFGALDHDMPVHPVNGAEVPSNAHVWNPFSDNHVQSPNPFLAIGGAPVCASPFHPPQMTGIQMQPNTTGFQLQHPLKTGFELQQANHTGFPVHQQPSQPGFQHPNQTGFSMDQHPSHLGFQQPSHTGVSAPAHGMSSSQSVSMSSPSNPFAMISQHTGTEPCNPFDPVNPFAGQQEPCRRIFNSPFVPSPLNYPQTTGIALNYPSGHHLNAPAMGTAPSHPGPAPLTALSFPSSMGTASNGPVSNFGGNGTALNYASAKPLTPHYVAVSDPFAQFDPFSDPAATSQHRKLALDPPMGMSPFAQQQQSSFI